LGVSCELANSETAALTDRLQRTRRVPIAAAATAYSARGVPVAV